MPATITAGGPTTTIRKPRGSLVDVPGLFARIISREIALIGVPNAPITIASHASPVTRRDRGAEGAAPGASIEVMAQRTLVLKTRQGRNGRLSCRRALGRARPQRSAPRRPHVPLRTRCPRRVPVGIPSTRLARPAGLRQGASCATLDPRKAGKSGDVCGAQRIQNLLQFDTRRSEDSKPLAIDHCRESLPEHSSKCGEMR